MSTTGRPEGDFRSAQHEGLLMSTIYRKTAKGVAEIETRTHRLVPRLRSALILVDGKRTDDELTRLVLAEPAATLASLLADGFIEVLTTLAERPPQAKLASAPSAAAGEREREGGSAGFEALRRDAARDLNHQLGPNAEVVTIKMERAKNAAELQPLLVQGAQMLHRLKGLAVAEAFAARFITNPEA
jgi:hypothetical protein